MAFDWNQYPTDDNAGAGMPTIGYNRNIEQPWNTSPNMLAPNDASIYFDPSQASQNTGISGYGPGGIEPPAADQGTAQGGIDLSGPMNQTLQTAQGTGRNWDQASFSQQFGTPRTPQELVALEQQLNANGIKVLRNASGVAGKIQLPNGQIVDVINSAGAGGAGFQWLTGGGGGGTGGGGTLAGLGYDFGSAMAPWTEQFSAPTAEQAMNTPGVQFGLDEANRMMQNSAAAKGTLLNARRQQAISASNIGNALQSYGDIYNRAMGEYGLRRENFYNNQDRPFNKNLSLAQLGKPAGV